MQLNVAKFLEEDLGDEGAASGVALVGELQLVVAWVQLCFRFLGSVHLRGFKINQKDKIFLLWGLLFHQATKSNLDSSSELYTPSGLGMGLQ
jgi:hypothetical protein